MRSLFLVSFSVVAIGSTKCAKDCMNVETRHLSADAASYKRGCSFPQDGTPYMGSQDDMDEYCHTCPAGEDCVFAVCESALNKLRSCAVHDLFASAGQGCCADDTCVDKQGMAKCGAGLTCKSGLAEFGVCTEVSAVELAAQTPVPSLGGAGARCCHDLGEGPTCAEKLPDCKEGFTCDGGEAAWHPGMCKKDSALIV